MITQESTTGALAIRTCFQNFVFRTIIGGVIIFIVFCLGAVSIFGSVNLALAALRGEEVIIESVLVPEVASQSLSIVAVNLSRRELMIVGAESGCGCIEFGGLPAKIPPRDRCVFYATNESGYNRSVASKAIIYTTSLVNPKVVAIVPP